MHLHICWSIAWRDSRSPLEIWLIHFDDAARTLEVTTQRIRQNPDSSLSCNARTNDRDVWYRRVLLGLFDETFGTTVWLGYLASNEVQLVFG